jgi:hypothetical protein
MYGTLVVFTILVLRVVIPVVLLLWLGEVARRRSLSNFGRMASQA